MSDFLDSFSGVLVGSLLLLTPTIFIQGLMVMLIVFLIWIEYFSNKIQKGWFEYITLPLSGIMSSVMVFYAPIIATSVGWAIAFITYTLFISFVLRIIYRKFIRHNADEKTSGESHGR